MGFTDWPLFAAVRCIVVLREGTLMNSPQKSISLSDVPCFAGIPKEQVGAIGRRLERRAFRRGTTMLMAGEKTDRVYIVQSGLVRVCTHGKDGDTDNVLLAMLGPGEIIGEIHALDGLGHSADVLAAQDCTCWCLTAQSFEEILRAYPDVALNLLRLTMRRVRNTTDKITLLATQDSKGRVARQLLIFAHQCGVDTHDGAIEIPLPLTQSDIAALTGVSRQSVNEAFAHFRKSEAISTTKEGHTIILKPDFLAGRIK
jgi:CRP-like cAMP-binding protein